MRTLEKEKKIMKRRKKKRSNLMKRRKINMVKREQETETAEQHKGSLIYT